MSLEDRLFAVCIHVPQRTYFWEEIEQYMKDPYFATCKNCGTDYKIKREEHEIFGDKK